MVNREQNIECQNHITPDRISGVPSSFPVRSHTFVEIDHEIISTAFLPSAVSRRVVVSYKRKYVHEVLASLPRKKMWLGELTVPVDW